MSTKSSKFSLADRPDLQAMVAEAREAFQTDTSYAVAIADYGGMIAARRADREGTQSPVEPSEPPTPHECPAWHPHGSTADCKTKHGCRCRQCESAAQERLQARRERDRVDPEARPVTVTYGTPRPAPERPVKKARPERINNTPKTPASPAKQEQKNREHGTSWKYRQAGCRCEECLRWNRERTARARASARNRPVLPEEHGRAAAYGRGCRCEPCRAYKKSENMKYAQRREARLSAENS